MTMVHRGSRRTAVAIVALALTVGSAACGSDAKSSSTPVGTGATATAAAATAAPAGATTTPPTGQFNPPAIYDKVPAAVASACKSGGKIDEIKKSGTLNFAIGVSPPFGFKLPDGQWAGVEAQAAAEISKVLGVKFSITDYSYDILPTTLSSGQADIIGAQLFVTPKRKEVIDFSTPYYKSGQLFYVLKDSKFQTIDDLNKPDVRFVYGTGGGQLDLAKKYIPNAKISDAPLKGQLLLYDFLAAKQADASMTEGAPMKVILDSFKDPALAAIGLGGRVTTDHASDAEILDPFDVAFGLPKGDTAWKGCVDAYVKDLIDSGRMTARLDYWLAQKVG